MIRIQLSPKIIFASIFLALGAFATKVKVARLTPGERKQILDDARVYDLKNKQSKSEICKKDGLDCKKEKTTERNPDSSLENPKKLPAQEKKQN
jgi:hypothetical protein